MMRKITIALVSILIVLAGIAFYCTPYLTYRNIRMAAENKDAETLSEYIDFPAIKKSLKENFKSKIEVTEKKTAIHLREWALQLLRLLSIPWSMLLLRLKR